jgi:O-antigen/teichoic acid export membrane protein
MSADTRLLVINSASTLGERLVNLLLQVWLYQYLVKRISPEEYSLYPVLTSLFIFIPPLFGVFTSGFSRHTVQAHAREDDQGVVELTSTMFPVLLAAGTGLLVLGLLAAEFIGSIVHVVPERLTEARMMVILLSGSLAFRVVLVPFSVGLYVRQKFVIANTLTSLQTVIRLALLFVLLLGAGPRVLWVVVATVAADAAIVLMTTVLSLRALPAQKFRRSCIRWSLLPTMATFGFWNMIGWFAYLVRTSADFLVLNRLSTPQEVTTFHLASLPDNQVETTLQRATLQLQPHAVKLHTTSGIEALRGTYTRGGRYCLWAALFVATPLIVFRQELWAFYLGPALGVFADVPLVMLLLLVRYWLDCPVFLAGIVAYAAGEMRNLAILLVLMSCTNLAFTLYLVGVLHMGAVGSALGTLISVVLWEPFVFWGFTLKLLGLKFETWFRASVVRGVLPSIVAGLFALGLRHFMERTTLTELILAIAAVGVVYALSLLFLCFDDSERGEMKQLWGKFYAQFRTYKSVEVHYESES